MMEVKQNLVSESMYSIKCPYAMNPEYIVVHNTANDASAENEVNYMRNNSNQTSFHYAVDDKKIVQGIPENRNAWHAGDGKNGRGNRKGISVEICYSKSGGERFTKAEKLAAKFIASKLKEKGWGMEKVTKHQDYSGKYCPHRTLDMGWQRFLDMVQEELNAQKELTLEECYNLIKTKANLEDITMQHMLNYDCAEALLKRLAEGIQKKTNVLPTLENDTWVWLRRYKFGPMLVEKLENAMKE